MCYKCLYKFTKLKPISLHLLQNLNPISNIINLQQHVANSILQKSPELEIFVYISYYFVVVLELSSISMSYFSQMWVESARAPTRGEGCRGR